MSLIVDSSRARERACALWLLAVTLLLSACGDKFTADDAELGLAAGDAGTELAFAGAAGVAAPLPPSGGDGGRTTTTTSAGAAGAPSAGAGGGGSCLAGWKGSSCDKCAGISDQNDRAGCESVVTCCDAMHLDCKSACTTCGCGFSFDQPAAEVFTCMCGDK